MPSRIKCVFFDFMGTCLDWHSSIVSALPSDVPKTEAAAFALRWREAYFAESAARFQAGLPVELFDITMARAFDRALLKFPDLQSILSNPDTKRRAVAAWHQQRAWPDVAAEIAKLREQGCEVFVHANGSTRLQLDLTRSAGLRFDMLFSSQLLDFYKPAPEAYRKAMDLIAVRPEECCMIAAHAYDLRGAAQAAMKTVYIYRSTDDTQEDQNALKKEFEVYLDGMKGLAKVVTNLGV